MNPRQILSNGKKRAPLVEGHITEADWQLELSEVQRVGRMTTDAADWVEVIVLVVVVIGTAGIRDRH